MWLRHKWIVSFDEKDALWTDSDGYDRVPFVNRCSDGDFRLDLDVFGRGWFGDDCILVLCDC